MRKITACVPRSHSRLHLAQEDIIDSIVGDAAFEDMPDFIVTEDVTGVNAGPATVYSSIIFCIFHFSKLA